MTTTQDCATCGGVGIVNTGHLDGAGNSTDQNRPGCGPGGYPASLNNDEARIIEQIILSALAMGCSITVSNGGDDYEVFACTDADLIRPHVGVTDHTQFLIRAPATMMPRDTVWVLMVHGNSPHEVVADHSDTPFAADLLSAAASLAEAIAEDEIVRSMPFVYRPRHPATNIGE